MEVPHFTEMLKNLSGRSESIQTTAEYCWQNKTSGEEIIKLIDKEMLAAKKERKLYFFFLIHEIVLQALRNHDSSYIKLIGAKIKSLLNDFARCVDSSSDANNVNRLIDKWSTEQVFADTFIERLKEIIVPVCKRLLEQSEQTKTEKLNLKYSKTFLVDYNTLQEFEPAKRIYQDHVDKNDLEAKLIKFNHEYNKLDLNAPTPEAGQRAAELLRAAEEYREGLLKVP